MSYLVPVDGPSRDTFFSYLDERAAARTRAVLAVLVTLAALMASGPPAAQLVGLPHPRLATLSFALLVALFAVVAYRVNEDRSAASAFCEVSVAGYSIEQQVRQQRPLVFLTDEDDDHLEQAVDRVRRTRAELDAAHPETLTRYCRALQALCATWSAILYL